MTANAIEIRLAQCLACGSEENHAIGVWDHMPLSILALPESLEEARNAPTYTLDVRRCATCGHVWHTKFDTEEVSYKDRSNLVWNAGHSWAEYQDSLALHWIRSLGLENGRVVEVGAGDGGFLQRFHEAGCRCIAWEPGPDAEGCAARGLEVRRAYFGEADVIEVRPDAVICRHVIEHLSDPVSFLRDIRRGAIEAGIAPLFLAEVPRIDKALSHCRMNDFLYEHVSHFTEESFRVLFEHAGWEVLDTRSGYGDEVVSLVARPRRRRRKRSEGLPTEREAIKRSSKAFHESIRQQAARIRGIVRVWGEAGERVALWGATGKGAALINMCGLTEDVAPHVVDSDPRKHGRFVPGTGQRIESPERCRELGVTRVLVCTPWRARDIEHEIRNVHGLSCDIFVYHKRSIALLTDELAL